MDEKPTSPRRLFNREKTERLMAEVRLNKEKVALRKGTKTGLPLPINLPAPVFLKLDRPTAWDSLSALFPNKTNPEITLEQSVVNFKFLDHDIIFDFIPFLKRQKIISQETLFSVRATLREAIDQGRLGFSIPVKDLETEALVKATRVCIENYALLGKLVSAVNALNDDHHRLKIERNGYCANLFSTLHQPNFLEIADKISVDRRPCHQTGRRKCITVELDQLIPWQLNRYISGEDPIPSPPVKACRPKEPAIP